MVIPYRDDGGGARWGAHVENEASIQELKAEVGKTWGRVPREGTPVLSRTSQAFLA